MRNSQRNFGRVVAIAAWLLSAGAMPPAVSRAGDDPEETAQATEDVPAKKHPKNATLETMMKTLGGRQFWGDVKFFRGWRIQQNVFTEHYRLLDPKDSRYAFGSFKTCCDKLEELKVKL